MDQKLKGRVVAVWPFRSGDPRENASPVVLSRAAGDPAAGAW
jgi:hypothetical protein